MPATPWKKGYWYSTSYSSMICLLEDNTFSWKYMFALDYPDAQPVMECMIRFAEYEKEFGPANSDVIKEMGKSFYNMEMNMNGMIFHMVLSDDGTKLCFIGMTGSLDIFNWCDEELISKLKDNREPCDAPSSIYKPKPNNPGKIIWLSGPPGAGKSTSAQLLGRNHGYVFYEGDAFMSVANPFIDPNIEFEPWQQLKQKPLKGISVDAIKACETGFTSLMELTRPGGNKEILLPSLVPMYREMAKDIKKQWKRLGGNFAVSQAIITQEHREQIRKEMDIGSDLIFLVLNLTEDCQNTRLLGRHGSEEAGIEAANMMRKLFHMYEPAEKDEENSYNVDITTDMTIDDVMDEIVNILSKL